MISCNYPKYFPKRSEIGSQFWVDPHSIIVTNGGNGSKTAGNGSASLGKQTSIENGFCVVEVVGGPVYTLTHFLEYEISYLYLLMLKGIFH